MGCEFRKTKLGQVLDFSNGRSSPVRSNSSKFPVFGSNGIIGYADQFNAEEKTIIIGRVGSYCGSIYFSKERCWVTDNAIKADAMGQNDPLFMFYLLASLNLNNWRSGSGQPLLNQGILSSIPALIPKFDFQKSIAHILGTLDNKIELNRRMNATLEAMAQALFKSWFVDFDPVIDKALAAGNPIPDPLRKRAETRKEMGDKRKPLPEEIQAHFPDHFVYNDEMGWVPGGWEVSSIGEEAEIVGGGTPSTKNPDFWENGTFPWVTPRDFSSLQEKLLTSSSRFLTSKGLDKVSSGLLPKGTVLLSSRAPVGYLALTKIETAINQGFIAMKCSKQLTAEYILQWANSRLVDIKQAASGSTFAEISKRTFKPFKLLVPSSSIINAYTAQSSEIYKRVEVSVLESRTLTLTRDSLLPRLLSGEIRVHA